MKTNSSEYFLQPRGSSRFMPEITELLNWMPFSAIPLPLFPLSRLFPFLFCAPVHLQAFIHSEKKKTLLFLVHNCAKDRFLSDIMGRPANQHSTQPTSVINVQNHLISEVSPGTEFRVNIQRSFPNRPSCCVGVISVLSPGSSANLSSFLAVPSEGQRRVILFLFLTHKVLLGSKHPTLPDQRAYALLFISSLCYRSAWAEHFGEAESYSGCSATEFSWNRIFQPELPFLRQQKSAFTHIK